MQASSKPRCSRPTRGKHYRPRQTTSGTYADIMHAQATSSRVSRIESQHAPSSSLSGSYADIMASLPSVEKLAITQKPDEERPKSTNATLTTINPPIEQNEKPLHSSSMSSPSNVEKSPLLTPHITSSDSSVDISDISSLELPPPVSSREPCISSQPSESHRKNDSILFAPAETRVKGKKYGGWTNIRGDPEKLERLNQAGTKIESRWAC